MQVAYFDCFSGISGDMILGALIDLGVSPKYLEKELNKMTLPAFKLVVKNVKKQGIGGVGLEVVTKDKKERTLKDILTIIDKSSLDKDIKGTAKKIFARLNDAESRVHREHKERMHFHELGMLDTIVDVVGVLVGIKKLGIEQIYSSPLHLGTGFVKCVHGILPVPSPATAELLKGIPVYNKNIEAELVTPTGAVLITSLAQKFGDMPKMEVEKIGYGAGHKDLPASQQAGLPIPNLLRVMVGDMAKDYEQDTVSLIQTNIDDMNPQICGYLMDKLLEQSALDVWFTPIQMKKNRPAVCLSVLAEKNDVDSLCEVIFSQSTSIGVRISEVNRKKLARETKTIKTKYGKVVLKIGRVGKIVKNISPSYDDCSKLADKLNIPLKDVLEEAKKEARRLIK
ncbi:MAG: nickel pincer cofactor biosynthesis protein LarC [Candidatus Omnitrophica bacterium]|nr:nickel pincer cofactor biosynthesis protein LarC [Candidatus Omnitrophota bacterium]MBU1047276.1 nickel pincer cofactor biosynthesis protein LarC [Candidatus Omnitrophota bacterium]MBU1631172.1 nickel pincer cofactor biosynthesis protein LarC [Candidatus Omnitrophota bacterium]MBU1889139.1 nickel pincer cofactor biosynthesis protein LarC [Candidatus Omnitrophota bacterium]